MIPLRAPSDHRREYVGLEERTTGLCFWATNIGLALMVLLGMLPIGLMPAWASVEYGTWYARSAEFLHSGHLNQLRWMRMIGDSIFALGALMLGCFVLGVVTGHSYDKRGYVAEGRWEVQDEE